MNALGIIHSFTISPFLLARKARSANSSLDPCRSRGGFQAWCPGAQSSCYGDSASPPRPYPYFWVHDSVLPATQEEMRKISGIGVSDCNSQLIFRSALVRNIMKEKKTKRCFTFQNKNNTQQSITIGVSIINGKALLWKALRLLLTPYYVVTPNTNPYSPLVAKLYSEYGIIRVDFYISKMNISAM